MRLAKRASAANAGAAAAAIPLSSKALRRLSVSRISALLAWTRSSRLSMSYCAGQRGWTQMRSARSCNPRAPGAPHPHPPTHQPLGVAVAHHLVLSHCSRLAVRVEVHSFLEEIHQLGCPRGTQRQLQDRGKTRESGGSTVRSGTGDGQRRPRPATRAARAATPASARDSSPAA